MRHIAFETFTPSAEWQQKAARATAELTAQETLDAKLAFIRQRSQVWKDLGKELIAHFGNKCWYTDAMNYGARLDAEHFRPKAKTAELTIEDCQEADNDELLKSGSAARDGYWWLAFDSENLLLCAQVMNREAKRNFFPLHKDSIVATATTPNAWRTEIPAFLDPRKLEDVCLVSYDETGAMRPRGDLDGWDRLRVIVTNDCFGLSRFQPLIEGRQQTWQKCTDLIEQYVNAAAKQRREGTPNPVLQQQKNDALAELQKLLEPGEPFASVAASCLRNSRYEWAKTLASLSQSSNRGRRTPSTN